VLIINEITNGKVAVKHFRLMISIVICLFIITPLKSELNYSILDTNEKLNRLDPILANHIYIRFAENTSMLEIQSFLEENDLRITKRLLEYDLSYTKLRKSHNEWVKYDAKQEREILEAESKLLRTYLIEITNSEHDVPEMLCSKIKSECGIVEIAEPVYIPQITGEFIPNDPLLDLQQMHYAMKSYEAWDIYQGDTNVVIGISDTGVLQVHEDLEGSIWTNEAEIPNNDIDDDGNGYVDDHNGYNFAFHLDNTNRGNTYSTNPHGTGTAGLSSATVNNDIGVAGTGFKTKMFPFKTTVDGTNGIYFGYESMLYCAINDIDIVNCSWGGYSFSCVNESVIDYCVARGLIIVTGAGNHYSTKPFYPAAYKGVCAVGVTEPLDTIIPMTGRGYYVDIMAPGHKSWTTTNDSAYGSFCCTSGSAPLVAGMLALIKGLYPDLNNRQIIEFAKNCTDDISEINPNYRYHLPGRMNMLKAVTDDPFSKPGIDVESFRFVKKGETTRTRFLVGDTITCSIDIHNYLGDASNLFFEMMILDDNDGSLKITNGDYALDHLKSGEEADINFELLIEKENISQVLLRVDLQCEECENDYLMIPFYPTSNFINIENNGLALSLSDNGRIGYSDPPFNLQGIGLSHLNSCSYLWEAGIICTENSEKVVSQVRNVDSLPQNDLVISNPYLNPDENKILLSDGNAPEEKRIGLEISSEYEYPDDTSPCIKLNFEIKNVSGRDLKDLSMAYFFDWDIGVAGDSNIVNNSSYNLKLLKQNNSSSIIVYHESGKDAVGTLSYSLDEDFDVSPIAASFENEVTYRSPDRFSDEEKIKYLNSGTQYETDSDGDIAVINGIHFPGIIPDGDVRNYSMCLCADEDANSVKLLLVKCAGDEISSVEEESEHLLDIFPQPARDELFITFNNLVAGEYTIEIFDLLGREVLSRFLNLTQSSSSTFQINIAHLPSNYYLLSVSSDEKILTKLLIILK
jgi:hypothetical protein